MKSHSTYLPCHMMSGQGGGGWRGRGLSNQKDEMRGHYGHSQSLVAFSGFTAKPCLDRTQRSHKRKDTCHEAGIYLQTRGGRLESDGLSGLNPVDEQPFSCDQATCSARVVS